ncbi:hypothetical protein LCGC14_0452760 [marine sediment metagenome]|uniref:DNA (cytosine-5-)-methyltransferase n=1 Tax=marine sediment metagenome TaxID=412755 RepID=A0A0F9SMR7_9ZZZZ
MPKRAKIACFDLCCGAGALSEGFRQGGATVLGGIDTDAQALATAKTHCPTGTWERTSIEEFAESLKTLNGHPIRAANTLLAGLPCQGFSRAGRRDPADARNFLYKHLLRIVKELSPDHVVFENVTGMATVRTRHMLDSLISGLRRAKYDVASRVLDAYDFGAPQHRKRLFLVAVRKGRASGVFEALRPSNDKLTVRDAFRGLPGTQERKSISHVFMKHGSRVRAKLRRIKPGGPISYRRLVWESPADTLISGHRALPVHPRHPRAISVREAARLQGFDDLFLFEGYISSQIDQVANAVPPPLARALCSALRRAGEHEKRIHGRVFRKLLPEATPGLRKRLTAAFRRSFTRRYPWRNTRNPYRILVTELLLQRTNADLAKTVWRDVIELCPSSRKAASVDLRSLGALTRRIGIRSRCQTIKELGTVIQKRHRGNVPQAFDDLLRLPGVGLYIASAVRAICFMEQDFPVDTNAFRFVSRYFGLTLKRTKAEGRQLREFLSRLVPKSGVREYVYGFLDFAAQVCRPVKPNCSECPLRGSCTSPPARRA